MNKYIYTYVNPVLLLTPAKIVESKTASTP